MLKSFVYSTLLAMAVSSGAMAAETSPSLGAASAGVGGMDSGLHFDGATAQDPTQANNPYPTWVDLQLTLKLCIMYPQEGQTLSDCVAKYDIDPL